MRLRFEHWQQFLAIDEATLATLHEFAPLITPHIDGVLDALYARIAAHTVASATFKTPDSMARARSRQREHWLNHVFLGNFDARYLETTRAIGKTHQRRASTCASTSAPMPWCSTNSPA